MFSRADPTCHPMGGLFAAQPRATATPLHPAGRVNPRSVEAFCPPRRHFRRWPQGSSGFRLCRPGPRFRFGALKQFLGLFALRAGGAVGDGGAGFAHRLQARHGHIDVVLLQIQLGQSLVGFQRFMVGRAEDGIELRVGLLQDGFGSAELPRPTRT